MSELRDVAVVGGGPAGLSAALVLARARRSVTVIDGGRPRNACSASLHGFLTRDGTAPQDFLDVGRSEVRGYGAEVVADDVTRVAALGDGREPEFLVELAGGRTVRARRVVAATGVRDELPDIDGLAGRWGRDVLHCPYCHGHEVRDQALAVVAGDAEGAVHQALLLRQWSNDVVVLLHELAPSALSADDRRLLAARNVRVMPGEVTALEVTGDRLTAARLAGGEVVQREAVFVAPDFRPNLAPLAGLDPSLCESDMGTCVETDDEGRASVPGLWAVGNLADLSAQVLGAAELGSRAAVGINGELALEDARAAAQLDESERAPSP